MMLMRPKAFYTLTETSIEQLAKEEVLVFHMDKENIAMIRIGQNKCDVKEKRSPDSRTMKCNKCYGIYQKDTGELLMNIYWYPEKLNKNIIDNND
ncbi:MAG: hypothetical protein FH758_03780 [Firmicutes bacterium]|nr:hypothetical protein [Bacillota bacterium]